MSKKFAISNKSLYICIAGFACVDPVSVCVTLLLRKSLVISRAFAALSVLSIKSVPVLTGSCPEVWRGGRTCPRALGHHYLTQLAHWTRKLQRTTGPQPDRPKCANFLSNMIIIKFSKSSQFLHLWGNLSFLHLCWTVLSWSSLLLHAQACYLGRL